MLRKMRFSDYFKPADTRELFDYLHSYNGKTAFLAGGTDLFVQMKSGKREYDSLIDLKALNDMSYIREQANGGLAIGSLTNVRSLELSSLLLQKYPGLSTAASMLGSIQVRNRATIGGNLCNASPSADLISPLLALNADIKLLSEDGENIIPLVELFRGPGQTVLDGRILTEIIIPPLFNGNFENYFFEYYKCSPRQNMDLAVVGVSILLIFADENRQVIDRAAIALGAVAPVPMRAEAAELLLQGQRPSQELFARAAEQSAAACRPISDIRASAEYRRGMVRTMVLRGLLEACPC